MGTQVPPTERAQHPTFRPMSIVAKRSPISATAEFLLRYSKLFVENCKFFLPDVHLAPLLGWPHWSFKNSLGIWKLRSICYPRTLISSSSFDRTPPCDKQTDRKRATTGHSIYHANTALHGKKMYDHLLLPSYYKSSFLHWLWVFFQNWVEKMWWVSGIHAIINTDFHLLRTLHLL